MHPQGAGPQVSPDALRQAIEGFKKRLFTTRARIKALDEITKHLTPDSDLTNLIGPGLVRGLANYYASLLADETQTEGEQIVAIDSYSQILRQMESSVIVPVVGNPVRGFPGGGRTGN